MTRVEGRIKKLAAVFTLYRRVLNFFSTIRTLLHNSFLLAEYRDHVHHPQVPLIPFTILADKADKCL